MRQRTIASLLRKNLHIRQQKFTPIEEISKFNLLSLSIYSTIGETFPAWHLRATRGAIFHDVNWGYSGSLARNKFVVSSGCPPH